VLTEFWWENLREEDHFKDTDMYGRIILKCIFEKWDWGMHWIDPFQDRNEWWALVNAVTNLRLIK
jgi:hypothetical protein